VLKPIKAKLENQESTSKVKTSAIFIAAILLAGSVLQTSITHLPGQLLTEVYAGTVSGTDGDDDLSGTSSGDIIEGRGGDDNLE
jgi:hypothetical protein